MPGDGSRQMGGETRRYYQRREELRREVKREGQASEMWNPDYPRQPHPGLKLQADKGMSAPWDI